MSIFKAYDIRGTVPDQLNPAIAHAIGWGYARFIAQECGADRPRLVVARDMRTHSPEIAEAFLRGCVTAGAEVFDVGLCSTPMLYFATAGAWKGAEQPDGGAMVTASHNGPAYNGFKLSRRDAVPISGATGLQEIKRLANDAPALDSREHLPPAIYALPSLSVERWDDAPLPAEGVNADLWAGYANFLRGFKRSWPQDVKLAIDPANGMGCLYPKLLAAMGCEIATINESLDGSFPAHEANPIKAENMAQLSGLVRENSASLGVGFDGDADRVAFCDEAGTIIPCDLVTALIAQDVIAQQPGAAILYDLRSTHALPEAIHDAGGRPVRDRVGHSFMKATLRSEDCVFGGELSGHYYYRDAFYADSAIITVIEWLNTIGARGELPSKMVASVVRYAQSGEINYRVDDVAKVIADIKEHFVDGDVDELDGVTVEFPHWWFNLRPSNTEPLLRLNLEVRNPDELDQCLARVVKIIGGEQE